MSNKDKIIEALNKDLTMELAAIIQYMWQHVMATGMESPAFREKMKEVAIEEMRHAETFAERIVWLGGVPSTQAAHIHVGGSLDKMIDANIKGEREAIDTYKSQLDLVRDDPVTHKMLVEIIQDEEEHLDFLLSLKGE